MGAKCSSNKHEAIIDKGNNMDFESYREHLKQTPDNKYYEVKAKLWEISEINNKIKQSLLSKYLFFKPNGKFISRVIKKENNDEIIIEGSLDSNGEIKFSIKQRMIDQNLVKIKTYEGKVSSSEKGMTAIGKVFECQSSQETEKTLRPETFLLEFTKNIWKTEYNIKKSKSPTIINICLRYSNNIFSGIAFDDRGFSFWAGIEKNEGKLTLIQQYLDKNNIIGSDGGVYSYNGMIDKISFVIDGTVNNSEMDGTTLFTIKKFGKISINSGGIRHKINNY
jgi:hypothetical protein